jgi:hypothetical protein
MSSTVNVNQLARKGNLVVHLDASPSTYTAYNFNSGSRNGTNTSILSWPNQWTDLSGNNNHTYPIKNIVNTAAGILSYSSSAFPLSSSYLNNSVFINTSAGTNIGHGFRINPIQETTGPLSVFLWLNPKATTLTSNWYVNKRSNVSSTTPGVGCQWQIIGNNTKFSAQISYTGSNTNFAIVDSISTFSINTWYNVGFTLTGPNAGDTLTLYVNGVSNATTVLTNNVIFGSRQIIIGRVDYSSATAYRMNANLSQFLIYNACLTPQEVWNNYQITKYKHQT